MSYIKGFFSFIQVLLYIIGAIPVSYDINYGGGTYVQQEVVTPMYLAEDGEWYDSLNKAEVLSKESAESFCKVNADAYSSNMEDNQEYRYTIFEVETVIRKIGKSGVYSSLIYKLVFSIFYLKSLVL